jgi:hypothetical protein
MGDDDKSVDYKLLSKQELIDIINQYERYVITATGNNKLTVANAISGIRDLIKEYTDDAYRYIVMINDFFISIKSISIMKRYIIYAHVREIINNPDRDIRIISNPMSECILKKLNIDKIQL